MNNLDKRGKGRPRLPDSLRRHNLGLQLSQAEREQLQGAADMRGQPLSVFIRNAALNVALNRLCVSTYNPITGEFQ